MPDIPSQLFIPIGAVLAACITGTVSFVSLIISKEQKTSDLRQAWIDALRADLAEFSAQARRVTAEHTPYSMKKLAAAMAGEGLRFDQTVAELDAMSTVVQSVLKREWNRVKAGEPVFSTTKTVAKWTAIALAVALAATLAFWLWEVLLAT